MAWIIWVGVQQKVQICMPIEDSDQPVYLIWVFDRYSMGSQESNVSYKSLAKSTL